MREKWIAGAGLDVFLEEPLPQTSELYNLDNVLITPHSAGTSPQYWDRVVDLFIDNMRRYINKIPLENVVDKKRGY